jgi:hypothetical protein
MTGVEYFARHCLRQHPFERAVALPPQIGSDPDPVEVHVDAKRRRRRVIAETALRPANLRQIHAGATQFFRHRHRQITGVTQSFEVLVKEPVFTVVDGSPLGELVQQFVGQSTH